MPPRADGKFAHSSGWSPRSDGRRNWEERRSYYGGAGSGEEMGRKQGGKRSVPEGVVVVVEVVRAALWSVCAVFNFCVFCVQLARRRSRWRRSCFHITAVVTAVVFLLLFRCPVVVAVLSSSSVRFDLTTVILMANTMLSRIQQYRTGLNWHEVQWRSFWDSFWSARFSSVQFCCSAMDVS